MSQFAMVFSDKKRVEIASLEAAQAAFDKWAEGKSLSSRSFKPVPVIDVEAKKVVGRFSMNGRFWTEETTEAEQWALFHTRFFNKHL